ncbi:MAG: hypothetical protein ABI142_07790 [Bryocella sp.]
MDENQKSALIRMDMRGTSAAENCFDGIVAFPAAVEKMRSTRDDRNFAQTMIAGTQLAFRSLADSDDAGLLFVAATAQDLLYRYVMQLTVMDRYTRAYCSTAVRYFFERLSERRIRTFYILDNTLRQDRFAAMLELFELSGIVTTTPSRDGSLWPGLAARLRATLDGGGHAAYIEPGDLVNHLDAARHLGCEVPCVATFRNLAPDDPQHEIINFKAA